MEALTFYTNPWSRGRVVRWMLEEIGQPYDTQIVAFGPAMKDAAYLAINPMGKVPAIRHGATIVTEVAAICAYLADAFPAARLAPPPESSIRGSYYRWLFFAAGPVEAASTNKALGVVVPAERKGMVGYGSIEDVLATLESAVAGRDVLVGDTFTAADLYLGAQLGWLMDFGVLERRPEIERYVKGLRARPAAVRAAAIDDELAARQKAAAGQG